MGMFDDIYCEVPLPDGCDAVFQSKDFDCQMDRYTITKEGRLVRRYVSDYVDVPESEWQYVGDPDPLHQIWHETSKKRAVHSVCDMNFHGCFNFYTSSGNRDDDTYKWHEYRAKFTDGQLVKIEQVED